MLGQRHMNLWGHSVQQVTAMSSEPDCLVSNPGSALLNFGTLGRVPTSRAVED